MMDGKAKRCTSCKVISKISPKRTTNPTVWIMPSTFWFTFRPVTPSIRISIPPLSQERRQELIKLMHQKLESGKITLRQIRHEAMDEIKKDDELSEDDVKRLEKEIQKLTDECSADIDTIGKKKEEELLQI